MGEIVELYQGDSFCTNSRFSHFWKIWENLWHFLMDYRDFFLDAKTIIKKNTYLNFYIFSSFILPKKICVPSFPKYKSMKMFCLFIYRKFHVDFPL